MRCAPVSCPLIQSIATCTAMGKRGTVSSSLSCASDGTSLPFQVASAVHAPPAGHMSLTVVGSGVSTAIPVVGHLGRDCACADAIRNPRGPNYRNNVSLLITVPVEERPQEISSVVVAEDAVPVVEVPLIGGSQLISNQLDGRPVKHVLIDCGKTFRDAYFRVLIKHEVQVVDALLLTHGHADAVGGLDDLRDLQQMRIVNGDWHIERYIPTFLTEATLGSLKEQLGYVIKNSQLMGLAQDTAIKHDEQMHRFLEEQERQRAGGAWRNIGIRRSTALQCLTLPEDHPTSFHVPALGSNFPTYTLPVEHGKGYISLGFVFGRGTAFKSHGATREQVDGKSCVVYISDVSDIPPSSMQFLLDLVKIDVLYVDLLHTMGKSTPVHYCMNDAVELVAQLQPTYTYGVGMFCDVEHTVGRADLAAALQQLVEQGRVSPEVVKGVDLGYDGLELVLPQ